MEFCSWVSMKLCYVLVKDSVGTSLEEICKVVPGGCLVFFPSYKLLDKVSTRWQETGQWSRLNAQKSIFVGKVLCSFPVNTVTQIYVRNFDSVICWNL